jgi:transposase, IS5 family
MRRALMQCCCHWAIFEASYNREVPKLVAQVGRYAHAKQFKRMLHVLKKLKTVVGRVYRDVERKRAAS